MDIERTALREIAVVTPRRFGDDRGVFSEVFKASTFADNFGHHDFLQDNQSWSAHVGTIRGLHFQAEPYAQDKLVRVIRGRIMDVAVDIRKTSPTFGRHVAVELSAANWKQLWIPKGFAHGFCTLEPDTEVLYKVTSPYAPQHDFGVAFDDPALAISWPVTASEAVMSDRDRKHPRLCDLLHPFP